MKDDRETYICTPAIGQQLLDEFPGLVTPRMLYTGINRSHVIFIWPVNVNVPGARGRTNNWYDSAQQTANLAMRSWVRMSANMSLGAYEVAVASAVLPDPIWPEESFRDLLRIAFKNFLISDMGHPVLLRLRGEV